MANLAPQTELRLFGNVPLDKGYKNCVYLGLTDRAVEDFLENQLMTFNHHLYTLTEYTYFRENRPRIRVKMKADDLWAVNYLCYKNPLMGGVKQNKWFFGFVDETVYVNNEVTDIYFTPDIMVTWWQEANIPPCYVERMHEPNDYFGKNLMAEPVQYGDYKYATEGNGSQRTLREVLVDMSDTYTLVPFAKEDIWGQVTGDYGDIGYDGLVSGYTVTLWHTEEILDENGGEYGDFTAWLNDFWNASSGGERILGFFTIPKDLLPTRYDPFDHHAIIPWAPNTDHDVDSHILQFLSSDPIHSEPISKEGYVLNETATLDGYLPANPKMYTAPFCVCEVLAPNGTSMILRHEYMTEVVHSTMHDFTVRTAFRLLRNVFPPISLVVRPSMGYGASSVLNNEHDANYQIEFSDFPVGSWTWGVFQQWVTQQFVPTLIDVGLMAASFGGAMNSSFSSTSTTTSSAQRFNNRGALIGRTEYQTVRNTESMHDTAYPSGVKQLANLGKETYNWLTQTPASRGVVKSKAFLATGEAKLDVRCLCPNAQDAERIDRFLSKYGYTQDKVMLPMRNVREKWTYVQTNDCLVYGDMPSDICYQLGQIYDNGVTFWHSLADVGRYDFSRGGNDCLVTPAP